jgi:tetratricopeptide (TPR) repeat protein
MSSKDPAHNGNKNLNPTETVKISERLNGFLIANRKLFLIFGLIVIMVVVAIGAYTLISRDINNKATLAMEKLESDFDAWNELQEDKRTVDASASIVDKADSLIKKYSRRYASARASVIKSQVMFSNGDLEGAEKAYVEMATRLPGSHMAPVALVNASSIAEDRGQSDQAIAYLEKVVGKYSAYPGLGRALLSLGRIYEQNKQYDKAKIAYGKLIASGSESDWTKLAHDRIILMKSLGLAE